MRKKIVLDTNFLMIPGEFMVDIFEDFKRVCEFPFELCTTKGVLRELSRLSREGNIRQRTAARIGLALAKTKDLKIIDVEATEASDVDNSLVELAKKGCLIATQDRLLQKRLGSFVYLRQKKYLKIKA